MAPDCIVSGLTALAFAASSNFAVARQPDDICLQAIHYAASKTDVPKDLLIAVAYTESGTTRDGSYQPWPWTVNSAGRANYFPSRGAAERYIEKLRNELQTSFDIGCFQINYRWHKDAFDSPSTILSPDANALYAAQFLENLHQELGNWDAAIGAYHSRNPDRAAAYLQKITRFRNVPPPEVSVSNTEPTITAPIKAGSLFSPHGFAQASQLNKPR